jgi:hypothetical protein
LSTKRKETQKGKPYKILLNVALKKLQCSIEQNATKIQGKY